MSNFFELEVVISVLGLQLGTVPVTVVGALVEMTIMLALVKIANNVRGWFSKNEW